MSNAQGGSRPLLDERLVSVSAAALRLGVQKETIRRWIAEGCLPAVRLRSGHYRIRVGDLEVALPRRAVGGR